MSDVSTIDVEPGCWFFPHAAWDLHFQSKDFPEHESLSACIDGTIRSDGLFVRFDELWNPKLNGWARLSARFGAAERFSVRFADGKVAECQPGESLAEEADESAWQSPNAWVPVPPTIEAG